MINIEILVSLMNDTLDKKNFTITRPECKDVKSIFQIISQYADAGLLLPMTEKQISERIDSFFIATYNNKVIACVALRDFGDNLYELRSLAVLKEFTGLGIGAKLVNEIINVTINKNFNNNIKLFALTYQVDFFKHLGFQVVNKDIFPQKIWSDCTNCPKFSNCDEVAVQISSDLFKRK